MSTQSMVLAALASVTLMSGCAAGSASARHASRPPESPFSSTVTAEIDAPIDVVYDYVVAEDTPQNDLKARWPIAAVKGSVKLTRGGWDHPHARRVVVLDGPETLVEEIERFERPVRFAYSVRDFSFSVKRLVREGHGSWEFSAAGKKTRVSWTYRFVPRSRTAGPLVCGFVSTFFHPYMQAGMASIKASIERPAARPGAVELSAR